MVILAVAWALQFVAGRLIRVFRGYMARRNRGADEVRRIDTVANALRYFASVVVVLVAGMLILNELGISIAPILATAGVAGIAIAFGPGLSDGDTPAIHVRDLTGALLAWIEVGTPAAERLHRACKACDRVAVYCHKDIGAWLRNVTGARMHAPERLAIVELDRDLIDTLAARVERRTHWTLTVNEGELYVEIDGDSLHAPIRRHAWPE